MYKILLFLLSLLFIVGCETPSQQANRRLDILEERVDELARNQVGRYEIVVSNENTYLLDKEKGIAYVHGDINRSKDLKKDWVEMVRRRP